MNSYDIITMKHTPGLLVVDQNNVSYGGPYHDDAKATGMEKAKRRIRDLKRKDAAAINDQDAGNANAVASEPIKAFNDGLSTAAKTLNADINANIMGSLDAAKNPNPVTMAGHYPPERQRGCYPHISKHAYRR